MAGSGYNQDSNQITGGLYRVVVTMTSSTNYPVATGNTASGGLWPYDWTNSAYTNATSMTSAQALVLAQGNVRWQRVIESLDGLADCRILDVVVTAANGSGLNTDATNQPTVVAFTVEYYRDEFILGEYNKILAYNGGTANGTYTATDGTTGVAYNSPYAGSTTAITTTALALQDAVTSGIIRGGSTGYSRTYRVWNPAQAGDSQIKVTITQPNSTASNIYATVAVTQISGTTLAGSPL